MSRVEEALVVATGAGAMEVVGGLPLAARAVLALRVAGVDQPWVLAVGPVQSRLRDLLDRRGAAARFVASPAELAVGASPILVVPGDHLVDPAGVLRAPVCEAVALGGLVDDVVAGRPLAEALRRAGVAPGPRPGAGLFTAFDASRPAGLLESRLLESLATHTAVVDSYMAVLVDRRLSRPVTRRLLPWTRLSPSMVTLASIAIGLLGAAGLATRGYATRLAGVLGLVASIVLDCVDGELARARLEQSVAGAWLDTTGDYLVNLAVFVGMAVGLVRQGLPPSGPWVAAALVGGVVAAMLAMHLLFVRPALRDGGDLHWGGDERSLRGDPVAVVVEKVASRDYTYLLLGLALLGRLEWFLYAAAAGSWLFVAGVVGYLSVRRAQLASRSSRPPVPLVPMVPMVDDARGERG